MKQIIVVLFALSSCVNAKEDSISDSQRYLDSLNIAEEAEKRVDNMILNILGDTFDKGKIFANNCPIKVTKSYIEDEEYGISKYVYITVKNEGDKPVDAIKFLGLYTDNWGDKVKNNITGAAHSYLELQEVLRPGKAITRRADLDHDGATKVEFVVTKLHHTDNSVWDIENL